jgi:hypothetical protein
MIKKQWGEDGMYESSSGGWVLYSEAQAEIDRLKARYLEAINLMGGAVIERSCAVQMLADMVSFFEKLTMAQVGLENTRIGGELLRNADAIIKAADADTAHSTEFERIQIAAQRYETLRTLNARQFADLYAKNLETGTPFDELVDAITKEGS